MSIPDDFYSLDGTKYIQKYKHSIDNKNNNSPNVVEGIRMTLAFISSLGGVGESTLSFRFLGRPFCTVVGCQGAGRGDMGCSISAEPQ